MPSSNTCVALGKRLQDAISAAGLTHSQLADEMGVARQMVTRWCCQHIEPRRTSKTAILAVLRAHGWAGSAEDLWPVEVGQ